MYYKKAIVITENGKSKYFLTKILKKKYAYMLAKFDVTSYFNPHPPYSSIFSYLPINKSKFCNPSPPFADLKKKHKHSHLTGKWKKGIVKVETMMLLFIVVFLS